LSTRHPQYDPRVEGSPDRHRDLFKRQRGDAVDGRKPSGPVSQGLIGHHEAVTYSANPEQMARKIEQFTPIK
jgi:hypothetical protein